MWDSLSDLDIAYGVTSRLRHRLQGHQPLREGSDGRQARIVLHILQNKCVIWNNKLEIMTLTHMHT